jgi:hypothetical protein
MCYCQQWEKLDRPVHLHACLVARIKGNIDCKGNQQMKKGQKFQNYSQKEFNSRLNSDNAYYRPV